MSNGRRSKSSASARGFETAAERGYSGNGLSIFTRRIARPERIKMPNATVARLDKGSKLPPETLLQEYAGRVQWLEAELRTEQNAKRREKLETNLEIKRRRLREMQREIKEAVP